MKAVLRRSEPHSDADELLVLGDVVLRRSAREVGVAGEQVELRPKEFDLLVYLMQNRGAVLSRDVLLERVWGYDYAGGTRTVDVHVAQLRRKLRRPDLIRTIRGAGLQGSTAVNDPPDRRPFTGARSEMRSLRAREFVGDRRRGRRRRGRDARRRRDAGPPFGQGRGAQRAGSPDRADRSAGTCEALTVAGADDPRRLLRDAAGAPRDHRDRAGGAPPSARRRRGSPGRTTGPGLGRGGRAAVSLFGPADRPASHRPAPLGKARGVGLASLHASPS